MSAGGTVGSSMDDARRKADQFQVQFDIWILGAILLGLLCATLFGSFANACAVAPESTVSTPTPSPTAMTTPPSTSRPAGAATGATPAPLSTATAPASLTSPSGDAPTPSATSSPSAAQPASLRSERAAQCQMSGSSFLGALLAITIALAAFAIGSFVGFLFGLPRTLTGADDTDDSYAPASAATANADSADQPATDSRRPRIGSSVNTNLERVSNWLTTIIVGVGLTKLERLPHVFRELGDLIDPYFGSGGWIYAISATIYFSIAGFFFVYVGTRVKLSLIFVLSQRNNDETANSVVVAQVAAAKAAPPIPAASDPAASPAVTGAAFVAQGTLQQADDALLKRSLTDLKTNDEVIAWSNAKARQGDFAAAITGYQDVFKRVPATPELNTNYATILAATGDKAGADGVIAGLQATSQITPDAAAEARARVSNAGAAALRSDLQAAFNSPEDRSYDKAIQAGEELFALPDLPGDAEARLWLARAYGRRLSAMISPNDDLPDPLPPDVEADVARAVEHVKTAVAIDPSLKPQVLQLYDPTQVGEGDDLQTLFRLKALADILTPPADG